MKRLFFLLLIIGIISCYNNTGDVYVGTWIEINSPKKVIDTLIINKISDNEFMVNIPKFSEKSKGTLEDGKLITNKGAYQKELEISANTKHLIYTDYEGTSYEFIKL